MSPLMYAGREGRPKVIECLVNAGANLHKEDSRGYTVRQNFDDHHNCTCLEIFTAVIHQHFSNNYSYQLSIILFSLKYTGCSYQCKICKKISLSFQYLQDDNLEISVA